MRFLQAVLGQLRTKTPEMPYHLEASLTPEEPSSPDLEDLLSRIQSHITHHVNADIQSNPEKGEGYYLEHQSNELSLTLEIQYFRAEELLDWVEQKQRWMTEEHKPRADRIHISLSCSEPEPVDNLSEFLTTLGGYTVSISNYS